MKSACQFSFTHLETEKECSNSNEFLDELKTEDGVKTDSIRLRKNFVVDEGNIQCRAWYVIDMDKNNIINGPFENRRLAARCIEDHESLSFQSIIKGDELLRKNKNI